MTGTSDFVAPATADGQSSPEVQTYTRKATGLVREVRLADMFAFNASAATPAGLVLAITVFAVFASFPGANIVLGLVIAGLVLPVAWTTFALMSAAMPGVGGDYLYGSRVWHPVAGLFSNAGTYGCALLSLGLVGRLFVQAGVAPVLSTVGVIAHSKGWLDAAQTISSHGWILVLGAILIVAVSVMSISGTKVIARVMAWAYFLALGTTAIALLVLLFTSRAGFISAVNHVSEPFTHSPDTYGATIKAGAKSGLVYPSIAGYSAVNTLGALSLLIPTFMATFYGVFLAGEMKGAGKRSRQLTAQVGSGLFQVALVLIGVLIFVHAAGYSFVVAASNGAFGVPASPFFTFFAATVIGSPAVALVLGVLFAFALPPWLYGNLGLCQRVPFALAFDGLLPKKVAEVDKRTHTPVVSIVINMVFGLGLMVYAAYATSFVQVLAFTALPFLMCFVVVGSAAVIMPRRRPELYYGSSAEWRIKGIHVLPVVGAGSCLLGLFLYYLLFRFHKALAIPHVWTMVAVLVGMALVAIVIYFGAKIANRRAGIDIDLTYRTLPID